MAVENAQAPGRQHQQAGAGKQNAYEPNGSVPFGPVEARRDDAMSHGVSSTPSSTSDARDEPEQRRDGSGHPLGFLVLAPRAEPA